MNADESTPSEPVRLLKAIRTLVALTACLLGLLTLGAGLGAWFALQRLGQVEARALAQAERWRTLSVELGAAATRRQAGLSSGLIDESRQTREQLAALQARRSALSGHPPDPLGKLDRVIELNALMADELLLLLRHAADSQTEVGRSLRPLPEQRSLEKTEERSKVVP